MCNVKYFHIHSLKFSAIFFLIVCSFNSSFAKSASFDFEGNRLDISRGEVLVFPVKEAPAIENAISLGKESWSFPDFTIVGRGHHWIFFKVLNKSNLNVLVIDLNWPFVKHSTYFAYSDGEPIDQMHAIKIGKGFNNHLDTSAVFYADVKGRSEINIYIKVDWGWGFNPQLSISSKENAQKAINKRNVLLAGYASGIIVILIISFLSFLAVRHDIFYYYIGFLVFFHVLILFDMFGIFSTAWFLSSF